LPTTNVFSDASTADDFVYSWKLGPDGKPAIGLSEVQLINQNIKWVQGREITVSLSSGKICF